MIAPAAEEAARVGGMQVALAEMHALDAGREGEVDPVVDEERHARARHAPHGSPGSGARAARASAMSFSRYWSRVQPPCTASAAICGQPRPVGAADADVEEAVEPQVHRPAPADAALALAGIAVAHSPPRPAPRRPSGVPVWIAPSALASVPGGIPGSGVIRRR